MALSSLPDDCIYPYEARIFGVDQPRLNLTYNIQPFSLLYIDNSPEIIPSLAFVAGNFLWKLLLFPKGPPQGHVAFGLVLDGTRSGGKLPVSHKVDAKFNIYLYNHFTRKFVKIAGNQGSSVRFEGMNIKTQASPSLSLTYLSYPPNGYLHSDACVFGVEVLVWENTYQHDCLSTIKGPVPVPFTWKMDHFQKQFSNLQKNGFGKSPTFKVGKYECVIMYYAPEYPAGTVKNGPLRLVRMPVSCEKSITETEDRFFSLYVFFCQECLEEDDNYSKRINVKVLLRIKDQSGREEHVQEEATGWIDGEMLGWPKFIELGVLTNPEKGYLVDDTITIEAEVTLLASLKRERVNSGVKSGAGYYYAGSM